MNYDIISILSTG